MSRPEKVTDLLGFEEKPLRHNHTPLPVHERESAPKRDNREEEEDVVVLTTERYEQLQTTLRRALESSRRQMEEISRVVTRYLPQKFSQTAGLQISAICRPCADVGGDLYDVIPLEDGRAILYMADVAGHGASAVVAMATTRSLVRAAASELPSGKGPAYLMHQLSIWFEDQLPIEQFVTMWVGIWDPAQEMLSFSSAAHPAAILWTCNGEPEFLPAENGFPIGLAGIGAVEYPEQAVSLGLGDRVFLYTDGWNESASRDGHMLDGEHFLDFVGNALGQPTNQVPAMLFMEFERHAANSRIRDDVSLLVFDRVE